jgi:hypothetical protein
MVLIKLETGTCFKTSGIQTAIVFSCIFLLSACGSERKEAAENAALSLSSSEEKGSETYEEFDERRDALKGSRGTFADQGCSQDCGGHNAGYAWAEEKGITNPDYCGGRSWSFVEGCRAYAEQASAEGE